MVVWEEIKGIVRKGEINVEEEMYSREEEMFIISNSVLTKAS